MKVPAEITRASISDNELVLPYKEALQFVDWTAETGTRLLGWEGWFLYPNGNMGHSLKYQGTVSLHKLSVLEACEVIRGTIEEAQAEWVKCPEPVGALLRYCITVDT